MVRTPPPSIRRLVAVSLALALFVSACGDDTSDADGEASVSSTTTTTPTTTPTTTASAGAIDADESADAPAASDDGPSAAPDTISFTLDSGADRTIPVIDVPPQPALPADAIERQVEIDGHRIFTIEIPGEGPTIVLMHGFPDNLHLYTRIYPELVGRHVIAFDHIGWGRSDKPLPGSYTYNEAQQRRELETVMDTLELDDVVLVVHDASGPPGIEYVVENPDRVERFVMLNTFYGRNATLQPPKGIELHADDRLEAAEIALQRDAAATEAYFRFQMDEFIVADPDEQQFVDELWSFYIDARPAFIAINDVLIETVGGRIFDYTDTLNEIAVPTQIVFGVDDPYLNVGVAEDFATHIADSTLQLIDDAGHFVQIDAPQAVAAAILGAEPAS